MRWLTERGQCAYCGGFACFAHGPCRATRHISLCAECWKNYILDENAATEALEKTLPPGRLKDLTQKGLSPSPSFVVGMSNFYLRSDLDMFSMIMFEKPLAVPSLTAMYDNDWRRALRIELKRSGMSHEKAVSMSENVFPPDGLSVKQVAVTLLNVEKTHNSVSKPCSFAVDKASFPQTTPVRNRTSHVDHTPPQELPPCVPMVCCKVL